MNSITSIQEAIKALAQSLNVATIFPSTLFVLVQLYWVMPIVAPNIPLTASQVLTIAISTTLILSYLLYAFNFPLIRLLEGYKFKEIPIARSIFTAMEKRQRAEFEKLTFDMALQKHKLNIPSELYTPGSPSFKPEFWYENRTDPEIVRLEYRLDRHFPSQEHKILPTRLGNTIAAFEDYSYTRYGIDSIALWPRLVPILKKGEFLSFVNQEKAVFDFLLNMCAVIVILEVELFYLYLFLGKLFIASVILVAASLLAVTLYQGLIIAARQWGTVVRVAFDLHRHQLHHRLGLKSTDTFESEFDSWQRISRFLLTHEGNQYFKDFQSQFEINRKMAQDKT